MKQLNIRLYIVMAALACCQPYPLLAQDEERFQCPDSIIAAVPAPPASTYLPGAYEFYYPCYADRFWELHEGFNARLSAGVSVGSHRSAITSQQVAFGYAKSIGKHVTVAAGLSATHYNYGSAHGADVTASASVAYKPNDRLSLYAWVQKSFTPHRPQMPLPAWTYYLDTPRDAVGFAAEYRIGESAWLSVFFEASRYDNPDPVTHWPPTHKLNRGHRDF